MCIRDSHNGTFVIVGKKMKHLGIGFTPVNDIICCLIIKGKFFKYTILNIHIPMEESYDTEETFFILLKKTYYTCLRNDVKIVTGDMIP